MPDYFLAESSDFLESPLVARQDSEILVKTPANRLPVSNLTERCENGFVVACLFNNFLQSLNHKVWTTRGVSIVIYSLYALATRYVIAYSIC